MESTKTRTIPTAFDYTMVSTWLRCRKRYYYRIVRGLVGLRPPTAAEFGKCIHTALDEWYKEKDDKKAIQVFLDSFIEDETDNKRTHAIGSKLLSIYFDKYRDAPIKVLATEQVFELPLPGVTDIKYIGRIDKIIEWGGATYVMDHKTTSRLGFTFFYLIKPNRQFTNYIWAARQLGHTSCNGVVLDALLVAKGLVVPAQLSRLTPVARDVSTRTEEEITDSIRETESIIRQILACYDYDDGWVCNTDACVDYVECPYRKICKEEKNIQDSIIASDYKVDHWDPRHKEVKDDKVQPKSA